jgi:Leucine-rich repeat (LRR) protein
MLNTLCYRAHLVFTNAEFLHWCTEGFICNFLGIECWHPHENKVLNIKLADLGLKGQLPRGVQYCTNLTGLDLSSNNLNGSLPDDVDYLIPFITSLDLSSNSFSGEIPKNLANCTSLNVLKLDNKKFSGQIPPQFGQLSRIKTFTVTNNQLSGPVDPGLHRWGKYRTGQLCKQSWTLWSSSEKLPV